MPMTASVVGQTLALGLVLLALPACGESGDTSDAPPPPPNPFNTTEEFATSNYEVLVRFPDGPANIPTQTANNNLDVTTFQGRTFLVWRTAPTHFASSDAEIVVASEGPEGWRFEGRFSRGTDLREPRLLALGDRLFLYFAVLGTDPTAFQPQGAMVTEYHGPTDAGSASPSGQWDEPEWLDLGDFIPWRAKVVDGKAFVVGYDGGENIYQFDGQPIHVRFLLTDDGRTLEPAWPSQPVSIVGGSSETDFALMDDGAIVSVSRNEAGDVEHGFGSLICRADASAPGEFHWGDVWLVARRNVTPTGDFDLGYDLMPMEARATAYNGEYSLTPKRCSLWRVDPVALTVEWVQDLPSRGDTCFPAMVPQAGGGITLYNYTSPLEDALDCASWPDQCSDPAWAEGQVLPTNIYRIDLALP
jgi:hypothetical protein